MSHLTNSTTPDSWIKLQGTLRSPLNSIPLQVLVDSSANDNFIDSEPRSQANLQNRLALSLEMFLLLMGNNSLESRIIPLPCPFISHVVTKKSSLFL